jgi:dipeptidyl-peptidase-4
VLLTEHGDSWIPLHHELTFLLRTKQFIWASSRDGFQHLYLYGNDGELIRPLTHGEYMVIGASAEAAVRAVDERARRVYFTANLPSPLERQMFSVSLDEPGEPRRVTEGAGLHVVTMSQNARVFVDSHSNIDTPPRTTLRRADGKVITVLVPNQLNGAHPYGPYLDEHVRPEFGTLTANDGQTMYYRLMKPRVLEAANATRC